MSQEKEQDKYRYCTDEQYSEDEGHTHILLPLLLQHVLLKRPSSSFSSSADGKYSRQGQSVRLVVQLSIVQSSCLSVISKDLWSGGKRHL
jgi:hypothetical protein